MKIKTFDKILEYAWISAKIMIITSGLFIGAKMVDYAANDNRPFTITKTVTNTVEKNVYSEVCPERDLFNEQLELKKLGYVTNIDTWIYDDGETEYSIYFAKKGEDGDIKEFKTKQDLLKYIDKIKTLDN